MNDTDYHLIPPLVRRAIDNWATHAWPSGSFVQACLENNLTEAFMRADIDSRAALPIIVCYMRWEIPRDCWGSPEKMAEWAEEKEPSSE